MDRFVKIYTQGVFDLLEIWEDRETGVQYLWRKNANAGGLTPLLDENGRPVGSKRDN